MAKDLKSKDKYNVQRYLTLVIFKNAMLVDKHRGNCHKDELDGVILEELNPI